MENEHHLELQKVKEEKGKLTGKVNILSTPSATNMI